MNTSIPAKYQSLLAHLVVLLLMAMPIFGHLDELPLETYDENRVAINATEMSRSGNLLVTTYQYKPEVWNTKPPLLTWIQALFLRIFGYNELSLRLPSAIAAALTCFLLLHFLKRQTGQWLPGVIAAALLLTAKGYVTSHGTRTCDYDAMLTLFSTAAVCSLASYVESGRTRMLYYSAAALTAAVFTKGIAGLFTVPAMIIYILVRGKGIQILKSRAFYISLAGFIMLITGYYLLRESQQPGYFQVVLQNEVGGRFMTVIETHEGDVWSYYDAIVKYGFTPWQILLIPSALAAIFLKDKVQMHLSLLSALVVLTLFAILTCASTKLSWYLMPVYPFLAMFCGIFLWQICELLFKYVPATEVWKFNLLPILLLIIIGTVPYQFMLDQALHSQKEGGDWDIKNYMKEVVSHQRDLPTSFYCGDVYPIAWYRELCDIKKIPLETKERDSLQSGMHVIAWEGDIKKHIETHYTTARVDSFKSVMIYNILSNWHSVEERKQAKDSL